ncbi:MAG: hypothetical protein F083_2956, partial [bacterium F083]
MSGILFGLSFHLTSSVITFLSIVFAFYAAKIIIFDKTLGKNQNFYDFSIEFLLISCVMEGMFSLKIAQLIEIFSAQMMLFDAIYADYLWIFCGKFITQIVHP